VPAVGLLGGVALYLIGHVAIRLRHERGLNRQRLGLALVLLAMIPGALELPSIAILAAVAALLAGLIVYETRIYGEGRARVRHAFEAEH
jgi:hypothetical protein